MAYGQSSGIKSFQPFASDIVLDALERADIFAPETKHFTSARRSLNLLLASDWSNRGINLWEVTLLVTPLVQGVLTYDLTPDIVSVLDTYRRQYQMNAPVSLPVNFTTQLNSSLVQLAIPNAGVAVGNYIQVAVQVSVGGLILYGFYQVTSTPNPNTITINAGALATANVNNGGSVPVFTVTQNSAVVSVSLPNHNLLAGQPFVVPVATTLGGITVQGSYSVDTVTDANNFTIGANAPANFGQTLGENGGQAFIAGQTQNTSPTDILMTPISRNDYAAQSNKFNPGAPTTYWVDKLKTFDVTVWPVTDATGPYEMRSYVMKQIDTVNPSGGETLDLVQRMFYACTLDLARDLAMKFSPAKYAMLKQEAADAWERASATDVENVSSFIIPDFSRY